jgi:hypothetical protein
MVLCLSNGIEIKCLVVLKFRILVQRQLRFRSAAGWGIEEVFGEGTRVYSGVGEFLPRLDVFKPLSGDPDPL